MSTTTPPGSQKLNLGCGTDIREGWVNLDIANIPGVNVLHNIEELPLPFPDGSFDEILCNDVLEHIEYIPVLKDIHRILAPGGQLHIRVPHFTSRNNFADPTHRRQFSVTTFDFFTKGTKDNTERAYYFDFAFDSIYSRTLSFEQSSRAFFYNRFVKKIANRSFASQERYEMTGFSRLFPAQNILITLVK